jgi:hypothetical protein
MFLGGDDAAVTGDCQNPIPGFDPAGLDSEDVQVLRNGWFIACDEYGKVVVFDSAGVIHVTYVPYGTVSITTVRFFQTLLLSMFDASVFCTSRRTVFLFNALSWLLLMSDAKGPPC